MIFLFFFLEDFYSYLFGFSSSMKCYLHGNLTFSKNLFFNSHPLLFFLTRWLLKFQFSMDFCSDDFPKKSVLFRPIPKSELDKNRESKKKNPDWHH